MPGTSSDPQAEGTQPWPKAREGLGPSGQPAPVAWAQRSWTQQGDAEHLWLRACMLPWVVLLRVSPLRRPGNHETDNMNQIYGFEGEVKAKYTAQMYELFSEVFEWLPLAQCINGKVLVSWQHLSRLAPSPGPTPSPPPLPLPTRSCTGACSAKMASPWTTSGRSSGIGSRQTQVRSSAAQGVSGNPEHPVICFFVSLTIDLTGKCHGHDGGGHRP